MLKSTHILRFKIAILMALSFVSGTVKGQIYEGGDGRGDALHTATGLVLWTGLYRGGSGKGDFVETAVGITLFRGLYAGGNGRGDISASGAFNFNSLPVTLVSFSGRLEENGVLLSWETGSEQDNHYFEVQRSSDGMVFDVIGKVNGHGTTTEPQSYTLRDPSPVPNSNYYRLRQVDYDGQFDLSRIIVVSNRAFGEQLDVIVYPNPLTGEALHVDLGAITPKMPVHLRVLDVRGHVHVTMESIPESSQHTMTIDHLQLSSGIYFLIVEQQEHSVTRKLVIK